MSELMVSSGTAVPGRLLADQEYCLLLERLRQVFAEQCAHHRDEQIFQIHQDRNDLFHQYLNNLPGRYRREHECQACRQFLTRYGGACVVLPSGELKSLMWDESRVPNLYWDAVRSMRLMVEQRDLQGPLNVAERVWGTPVTGVWHHLSVPAPTTHPCSASLAARASGLPEDHRLLMESAFAYPRKTIVRAVNLLKAGAVFRSSHHLGWAEWLLELHDTLLKVKRSVQKMRRLAWRAVVKAPVGWCRVRSSALGALLDDLESGVPLEEVKRRHQERLNPLQYQRPSAAPAAGTIAQAERMVREMGLARSFDRRIAHVEEIQALWRPHQCRQPTEGGMFSHLTPKEARPVVEREGVPEVRITFEKFRRTVLPDAIAMELTLSGEHLYSMTAPVHADAPNLFQWDNPYGWYTKTGRSPGGWGLSYARHYRVLAVALFPHMWGDERLFQHHGAGAMFVLEGAADPDTLEHGSAMFPEFLQSQFHQIRSVVEAHSKSRALQPHGGPNAAAGAVIRGGSHGHADVVVRVLTKTGTTRYRIDRWD